ncbi:MAG TPA: FAD-dependent oxidoreductase [Spirochaetia bacterium]|nr:FAD-dependent oxidoreductase [Spirochaetia bacterium]
MGNTTTNGGAETDVVIVGGGATGCGLAWDLALRGVSVALVERGELASGTTGRFHGLLHSGARYVVSDPVTAGECYQESVILRGIAKSAIGETGGLHVFGDGDDPEYLEQWLDGCRKAGIPVQHTPMAEARRREPALDPSIQQAFLVPDAVCNSIMLCASLGRSAQALGCTVLTYHRFDGMTMRDHRVTGVKVTNVQTGEPRSLGCRVVVIAAGPWSGRIAQSAGVELSLDLVRGAMIAFRGFAVRGPVSRLQPPGDGDIILPRGRVAIAGTTSVVTDNPDDRRVDEWELETVRTQVNGFLPGLADAQMAHAWAGVRPLYNDGRPGRGGGDPHSWSRDFTVLDHERRDGVSGLVSIVGGKLTSFRLMAEKAADTVCGLLGSQAACRTSTTDLG